MNMAGVQAWLIQHPGTDVVLMKTEESHYLPPEKIRYWTRPGDILLKLITAGSNLFVLRPFRKYEDWMASLLDWSARIQRRYPLAYVAAKTGNFVAFAQALQVGGYATDPEYAGNSSLLTLDWRITALKNKGEKS